ncbi:Hypothetical_protein [Hexamita inflata]|uniref:Hypothetical_protein n=1 Tax=Hexamita inflata TaxID=28002 RepID=A0AA86NWS3_9EUKA|nr:Hypothetical protein HINF_LOCUS15717 [Hexamita inflata]
MIKIQISYLQKVQNLISELQRYQIFHSVLISRSKVYQNLGLYKGQKWPFYLNQRRIILHKRGSGITQVACKDENHFNKLEDYQPQELLKYILFLLGYSKIPNIYCVQMYCWITAVERVMLLQVVFENQTVSTICISSTKWPK